MIQYLSLTNSVYNKHGLYLGWHRPDCIFLPYIDHCLFQPGKSCWRCQRPFYSLFHYTHFSGIMVNRKSFIIYSRTINLPDSFNILSYCGTLGKKMSNITLTANAYCQIWQASECYLLYISTSVWVLRTPNPGRNSHFQRFCC